MQCFSINPYSASNLVNAFVHDLLRPEKQRVLVIDVSFGSHETIADSFGDGCENSNYYAWKRGLIGVSEKLNMLDGTIS